MAQDNSAQGLTAGTPPTWRKRLFRRLLPALATVLLVIFIGVIVAIFLILGFDLATQHASLVGLRPWGAAVQGFLIVLVGLRWQQVVDWGRRKGIVLEQEYDRLVSAKAKVMLMLAVYWLTIPVGPNALMRWFQG
jgi:hypothetical protein